MFRVTCRGLWARKRRLTGAVVAVVLGVAFLAGALALGDTLSSNFTQLFTNANAGTDAVVRSATTVGTGLDAQRPLISAALVDEIGHVPGVAAAQPSIIGSGALLGKDGTAVGGKGPPRIASNWVDNTALNPYRLVAGRAPAGDNEVVINRGAAKTGHLALGDDTTVDTPSPVPVRIVGIATFGSADGLGTATFTAFSLSGAQRYLTGKPGQVSSILVQAKPAITQAEVVARIQPILPAGVQVTTGAAVTQQNISDLSGAFLTALRSVLVVFAGIALLVATFSIANTFAILVAQRTREEALLRTIGASRRQILMSVLFETVAVGTIASALGLVGGFGIAGLLKGLFDAAGFALPAGGLVITTTTIVVSLLVGIAVTVIAGLVPAVRAARIAPLAALRDSAAEPTTTSRRRAVLGAVLLGVGVAIVITGVRGSGNGILGRVGIGALLSAIAVIVLAPVVARTVTGTIGFPFSRSRGVAGALARDNVMRNPRRSATAASALMIGVAVATLFTVFAASLKSAVTTNVSDAFVGDLAVGTGFGGSGLSPQLATAIARLPQVRVATGLTAGQVLVGTSSTKISAVDSRQVDAVLDLHATAGSIATLTEHQIAVSAHQADAKHWRLGGELRVTLPDGTAVNETIGAIYSSRDLVGDYVLPISLWSSHATQNVDSNIFVKLDPGADVHTVQAEVGRLAAPYGKPTVDDHAAFVADAGKGINFVLGIVYVLLALAVVIALFGIANTLSLSIHERTREIGLLRAIGQTRRQLRRTIRIESVIVSLFGTIDGLALGTFLGWGLAQAAHKAQGIATFTVPVPQLIIIIVVGAVAGILAALRPARRAARLDVLEAIRHE
jgi:putative ABC transport system permease protein